MIEELKKKYTPIIQDIIDKNKKFYGFTNTVDWEFFYNEDVAIFGSSKKDLKLYININSVDFSYKLNEQLHIEYFILHEIRHIYQRRCVLLLDYESEKCPNIEQAIMWKENFNNYKDMTNKEEYYFQSVEFDAFIFAYSVMIYKYGIVSYIIYPKIYDTKNISINQYIDRWVGLFRLNNL